ncbi:MAG: alpha-mannosidase [Planctomycetia bacterium]|nr:MAG: alpha-mannosidase [Planctomycetia bacterium]
MKHESAHHARRFAVFSEQVLAPAVIDVRHPARIEAYATAHPVPHNEAICGNFQPVAAGWRFGPGWSGAWFRISGEVPAALAGRAVWLRFSTGTEALLWQDGQPRHGLDVNHDTVPLTRGAKPGDALAVHVEAVCSRPFGTTLFEWDDRDARARWSDPQPGCLEYCEFVGIREPVWRLWRSMEFARELLALLPPDAARTNALRRGLDDVLRIVRPDDVPGSSRAAMECLVESLRGAGGARGRSTAVGHAHIDTAWLWPIAETRRKCLRSFSTVLSLMERFPQLRFICSQAQQYAWVERDSPALLKRIADRVREGRWEPIGGMWVEPDANLPSGESLLRQMLHADRLWRRQLGDAARQSVAFLPDTFGFPASLPQILRLGGLDTFVTNKLCWSDANEFPHVHFTWRGIDGAEILAHQTPGGDYNAVNTPRELLRAEQTNARLNHTAAQEWLTPFGYGDGGGGPTDSSILYAELAADTEGLPQLAFGRADELCRRLHAARRDAAQGGRPWPVWDGELYLENHRGVLTTQAWLKRANREAERDLRTAEWLTWFGPAGADSAAGAESAQALHDAWERLLTIQFHDILPGTSIPQVYDDARRDLADIDASCRRVRDTALARWAAGADTRGMKRPALVLNPASAMRCAVIEHRGELHEVARIPALGARVVDLDAASLSTGTDAPATADGRTLRNGILHVEIDEAGRIGVLRRAAGRNVARAPLNQLTLFDDRPRQYDAWDIDPEHLETAREVRSPAESIRVVESSGLRASIEVQRALGAASRITQRYVLAAGSPRLEICTTIDWHEDRTLLRALFPLDIRTRSATYEIQFGTIERTAHRSNPWDAARFEVCAHRWMDVSQPGCGVALLNDGKYGHSCDDGTMGLTLLRSPRFPDPNADRGRHEFTYALQPHDGDWRTAGIDRGAEFLNTPLIVHELPRNQSGSWTDWSPVDVETSGDGAVIVSAMKRAFDDDRRILRIAETRGGRTPVKLRWRIPVGHVAPVDALERPLPPDSEFYPNGISHDAAAGVTTLDLPPYRIVTLSLS